MKLVELNSVLRLYESNFRNLHWNSVGEEFNDSHKSITTEYYNMISITIDVTAEMLAMLGCNAPNYVEALENLKNGERNYMVVDSNVLYDRRKIVVFANVMLKDICELISEVLREDEINDPRNVGIKSELESILYQYDLQCRYINAKRIQVEE